MKFTSMLFPALSLVFLCSGGIWASQMSSAALSQSAVSSSISSTPLTDAIAVGVSAKAAAEKESKAAKEIQNITQTWKSLIPVDQQKDVSNSRQALGDSKELFMVQGRPDKVCPDWRRFVAKIELAKVDYTLYVAGDEQLNVKNSEALTKEQQAILSAIHKQDTAFIHEQITQAKTTEIYRTDLFLAHVLSLVWHENYRLKASAMFALYELTKLQKLPAYVYRVWGAAAIEGNYQYLGDPFFEEGSCRTWIRQLGIYQQTDATRVGLVHASCLGHGISHPLVRRTMSEEFIIVAGTGEFWLNDGHEERSFVATAGDWFKNPAGMHIQFRNLGDTPLTMLVPTFPPYDEVIKTYPWQTGGKENDLDKEVHVVQAKWAFNENKKFVAAKRAEVEALLKTEAGQKEASALIVKSTVQYLTRLFAVTLSDAQAYLDEKLALALNTNENWGLRVAAIEALAQALKGSRAQEIRKALEGLTHDSSEAVQSAAKKALQA